MARTIQISAKCSDLCHARIPHLNYDEDGYVPSIEGIGGGNYIRMEIDLDTGKVIGYTPMTDEQLKDALEIV